MPGGLPCYASRNYIKFGYVYTHIRWVMGLCITHMIEQPTLNQIGYAGLVQKRDKPFGSWTRGEAGFARDCTEQC